jgi:membrane dipeptidase
MLSGDWALKSTPALIICLLAPLAAQVSDHARKLHQDAFVFDGHVHVIDRQLYHGGDIGERVQDGQFDLPRAKEGGVDEVAMSKGSTMPLLPGSG